MLFLKINGTEVKLDTITGGGGGGGGGYFG